MVLEPPEQSVDGGEYLRAVAEAVGGDGHVLDPRRGKVENKCLGSGAAAGESNLAQERRCDSERDRKHMINRIYGIQHVTIHLRDSQLSTAVNSSVGCS